MNATQQTERRCVYEGACKGNGEGTHQCPYCKLWYCDVCFEELFLPLDYLFDDEHALICADCHLDLSAARIEERGKE